jgi:catechol 2,3-dioxygenase-like lactoylglutathione lyase family enzyme
MRNIILSISGLALAGILAAPVANAQLVPPSGNRGVSMGHLHLIVKDVDAQTKFWTDFGGRPVKNGMLNLIELPGVYIMLRQGEPTGGTVGSMVNHVGFVAKDLEATVAKWTAAGIKADKGNGPAQYFVTTAEGVRIEVQEDKTIATPLKFSHVHFNFTPDQTGEVQAWYARIFDAVPGTRGRYKSGDIAGANLTYGENKDKQAPTKGRALDHIGFDVPNLDFTYQKLMLQGVKFDAPPRAVNDGKTKVAFLTDPWGTYIELTEGLAPK